MVTRNFGNKIVGAVLSAAMVLTAIPVCTMNSLACENDHYGDGPYISAQPVETTDLETLIDYFTSVVNFFYDKEDILTSDEDEQCRSIFNSVSLVMRDPDADASDYSKASAALDSVVDLINNIIASAQADQTPAEEPANNDFEIDPQDSFTITPDFEIDPQDSFTLTGEPEDEIVAETAAETPATPAPAAAPAASAPVGQVLGAERNRAFVVDQIVESLYVNALDRNSDFAGKNSWVNMILTGEADIDTVVRGFLNSAEFEARDLSDDAFIMVLYRVMFNRVPSADELNNWTAALAAGTTRTQVIDAFLNSAEFDAVCDKYDL